MRSVSLVAPLLLAGCLAAQIRPLARPSGASKRFAAGPFAVWLNPAEWSALPSENGVHVFHHSSGYEIRVRADRRAASNGQVKREALAEFRQTGPDAEELNSEAWTAGGREVLVAETIRHEGAQLIRVLGAYQGGPDGSLRLELRTVLHITSLGRRTFREFVAGLDFGGPAL